MMVDIPKPKFELVEIKGASSHANNFNQTIKVSPKAFKVTTHKCIQKKKNIYNEMLQHYNNTLNYVSRIPTFIE
jgi:ABC-type maltose transport system permease subunit